MMLKEMYAMILLSTFVAVCAMDKEDKAREEKFKKTYYNSSPVIQASLKNYLENDLPKAAFGKNEKEIIGSNLQHGGNYTAVSSPNAQDKRFGRGSSGKQDSKL